MPKAEQKSDDDYFVEVQVVWDLPKLYRDLAKIGYVLTPTQKKYLRGVLSGCSIEEIDCELGVGKGRTKVVLSNTIYKAIRELTGETAVNCKSINKLLIEKNYHYNSPLPDEDVLSVRKTLCDPQNPTITVNGSNFNEFQKNLLVFTAAAHGLVKDGLFLLQFYVDMDEVRLDYSSETDYAVELGLIPDMDDFRLFSERAINIFLSYLFSKIENIFKHSILPHGTTFENTLEVFFHKFRVILFVKNIKNIRERDRKSITWKLDSLLLGSGSKVIFLEDNYQS